MEFNIGRWFKKPKERDYNEVELFMNQINADVSMDVRSILSSLSPMEEEKLNSLYAEIYNYKHNKALKKDDKISLIDNRFILDAISVNVCNYDNTKKIFDFVKAWDNETYLPKGIKLLLKQQISNEEITELEELYKKYNLYMKDVLKDKNNYYYINSQNCKNEMTRCFGNAPGTMATILKATEMDNRKKVSKDMVVFLDEMLNKRDVDGRILNKIILYKIRDIDNYHVVEDNGLNDMFSSGLVNNGNVLEESITTYHVKDLYGALELLKTKDVRYSGVVILEVPNIYFDKDNKVLEEYYDKVYISGEMQKINPDFIKGYISIGVDKCELYTKEEVLNEKMDMPSLKK